MINLVKPESLAKPVPKKVLVIAGDMLKKAYNIAERLREVGYIAELDLGGQKPADFDWLLSVQNKSPTFTLQSKTKPGKLEAESERDVLALLGVEGANKDSPAQR